KNTSDVEPIGGAEVTIWGDPADPSHDAERGGPVTIVPEKPFLTLPRSCEGPLFTHYAASSWEEPNHFLTGSSESALELEGCEKLGFEPEILAKPTTERAESPTGLDFNLDLKDEGLTDPTKNANSDLKKTVVALPAGMTLSPSAATGLTACSRAELARETPSSEPGEGCPEASKVGTVEAQTQLLKDEASQQEEILHGSVYVATPDDPTTTQPGAENPFDSFLALYMVIKDPELGILVRLAGKVDANRITGQLTTTFGEPGQEIPQFPVSHFRFHFRPGDRAPLVTPPSCGTYGSEVQFTTWANPASPIPAASSFPISAGIGGGPCPTGPQPFKPSLLAGSDSNAAGAYSPFYLRLTRNDGEAEITRLNLTLPPGVVAKIAGLGKCPDAQVAAAKAKTGRQELAAPSCPAASQVGRTIGGAGVGSSLTYVPGQIYLAGPFGGAQLSIVAITPAVAGPFDAGTVVVRQAISLDPVTGEAIIDGSASDPIPHILKGIPLRLRDLRVYVDRPNFTLNPTSCEPEATRASIFGSGADAFNPADDAPAALTSPYRASNCAALGFKPKLALQLKGGTRRNDHP